MASEDDGWTRVECARWFIDHDEIDEAARMLAPGDELVLGRSDSLDLAAALARHGLSGRYEAGRLVVKRDRKPAARATPASAAAPAASKKTA